MPEQPGQQWQASGAEWGASSSTAGAVRQWSTWQCPTGACLLHDAPSCRCTTTRAPRCLKNGWQHDPLLPPCRCATDREDELLVAQRKINQLKASGNSGGLAGGGAAAGEQAARGGGGSPVAGGPAAASADAADTARLHQLLQASAVGRWRQAAGGSAPPLGGARRAACMPRGMSEYAAAVSMRVVTKGLPPAACLRAAEAHHGAG